jgi:ferric-dicitrate binding protein FerR (iron transport regulator)
MLKEDKLRVLLHRYLEKGLQPEELKILNHLLKQKENKLVVDQLMEEVWNDDSRISPMSHEAAADFDGVLREGQKRRDSLYPRQVHRTSLGPFIRWQTYAAAAVFLVISGIGLLLFKTSSGSIFSTESYINGNQPVIVRTSTGQTRMLTLPDGSKVWLNASSNLKYPATFTGKYRNAILTGEAFFEIAHDKTKPFRLQAGGVEVQVLGTKFNVSADQNNKSVTTTLLEGSVMLKSGSTSKKLSPGQQIKYVQSSGAFHLTYPDTSSVVSWKRGEFYFDDTPVQDIMQQVSEWYGLSVVYVNGIPDARISGNISRTQQVSQVLEILAATRLVHFDLQNDTIIVQPVHVSKPILNL